MADMARFIKPILSVVPPDLGRVQPVRLDAGRRPRQDLPGPPGLQSTFVQLMTMSATEFLQQWFETDPLIATMSRRDHRDVPGRPLAWHRRTCCSTTTWARSTARSAWGIRAAAPADLGVDRVGGRAARQHHRGAGGADRCSTPPARCWSPARRSLPAPSCRAWTHMSRSSAWSNRRTSNRPSSQEVKRQVPRLEREGEPRARRPARARVSAGERGVAPRRDQLLAGCGLHGARVRRREVREVLDPPVHRLHHPHARRPLDGAAGQARDVVLVQYAPYHLSDGRTWTTPSATRSARP